MKLKDDLNNKNGDANEYNRRLCERECCGNLRQPLSSARFCHFLAASESSRHPLLVG